MNLGFWFQTDMNQIRYYYQRDETLTQDGLTKNEHTDDTVAALGFHMHGFHV